MSLGTKLYKKQLHGIWWNYKRKDHVPGGCVFCSVRAVEQRCSSPKQGEEPQQTTGRNVSFWRSQTASAETMQLPVSWSQSSRWLKGQRQPDQRSRHASVVLPKPPAALPELLGSLLQNAGQLALEGRPTGSETFPCLVCSMPSLNISESRKPLQKQEVFAAAVAGGWS